MPFANSADLLFCLFSSKGHFHQTSLFLLTQKIPLQCLRDSHAGHQQPPAPLAPHAGSSHQRAPFAQGPELGHMEPGQSGGRVSGAGVAAGFITGVRAMLVKPIPPSSGHV